MKVGFGVTGTSQMLNTKEGGRSRIPMVMVIGRVGGDLTGVWV